MGYKIADKGAISAILWSFIQKAGALSIAFVANVILARLLSPDDFGIVGILLVFVTFADIIVNGGFGNALIHKKELEKSDIDTVFTINIVAASFFFALFFFSAPFIADYLNVEKLDLYLRIESISIILRALYVVHSSILNRNLKFKDLATVNITSSFLSVLVAVIMAFCGLGVWSLIFKNIVLHISLYVMLRIKTDVRVGLGFEKKTFLPLFKYGWYIAITNFFDVLYSNIVSLIIGKRGSVGELGYYTQASSLQQIPNYTISQIINQVLFPYMSKYQDDKEKINADSELILQITSFVVFPIIVYLIFFSEPIIVFIYSVKWLPSAYFFKVLCVGGLVAPFIHINRNILKSVGRTDFLYRSQVISILTGIVIILLVTLYTMDIKLIVMSVVLNSFINYLVTSYFLNKEMHFPVFKQFGAILPSLLAAVASCWSAKLFTDCFTVNTFLQLVISFAAYAVLYLTLCRVIRIKAFYKTINYLIVKK